MRVDNTGFYPRNITIKKGESVLWTWKNEHEQAHNIINVNSPDSEVGLLCVDDLNETSQNKTPSEIKFTYAAF